MQRKTELLLEEGSLTRAWRKKKKINSLQPRTQSELEKASYIFFCIVQVKRVFGFLFTVCGRLFFHQKVFEAYWDHLKVYAEHQPSWTKKALKYTHTGPFLRSSQLWLGGVLLVYERENSPASCKSEMGLRPLFGPQWRGELAIVVGTQKSSHTEAYPRFCTIII